MVWGLQGLLDVAVWTYTHRRELRIIYYGARGDEYATQTYMRMHARTPASLCANRTRMHADTSRPSCASRVLTRAYLSSVLTLETVHVGIAGMPRLRPKRRTPNSSQVICVCVLRGLFACLEQMTPE